MQFVIGSTKQIQIPSDLNTFSIIVSDSIQVASNSRLLSTKQSNNNKSDSSNNSSSSVITTTSSSFTESVFQSTNNYKQELPVSTSSIVLQTE